MKETRTMTYLPKIALGAWAWGNDGTFGNSLTAESLKSDYHTFKPVLFEFPTYEYFVTGDSVGNCGKMN